jgi:4-hydroxybenzoate polyprenyltransferase
MEKIVSLLRVKHWIKNFIVLVPVCFISIEQWDTATMIRLLNVFISFCLSASMIYVFNDILDRKTDLLHPKKKHRPIACGDIKVFQAVLILVLLFVLLIVVVGFTHYLNILVIPYIVLNLFYSLWLKGLPIVDLMIVSMGYFLRLLAGVLTLKIGFPFWILTAIFFITLSVITGKRRSEMIEVEESGAHRHVLGQYNIEFLTYIILISAIIAINAYVIHVHDQFTHKNFNLGMFLSIPVILFGVLKYLYNIFIKNQGGDPVEEILKDKALILISVTFFLLSVIFSSKIINPLKIAHWFQN